MPTSYGHIRAVNPVSLATVSGVTKIPGFASSPIPPVIRPDLLTSQLMGCHPQCESCNGTHAGPHGQRGVFNLASYIPPDYGTLRGLGDDGEFGLFKMFSSQSSLPAGPGGGGIPGGTGTSTLTGLGKSATGTNASYYGVPSWRNEHAGRGLGKSATGTNASYYGVPSWRNEHAGRGLGGLGQTAPTSTTNPTLSTDTQNLQNALQTISKLFRPGASEADAITKQAQPALAANLNNITNQFLTGSNPSPSQLQSLYLQTWAQAVIFAEFVLGRQFTDRRASGQALNTVMPLIDGTCGYAVPLGFQIAPTQQNCQTWGDGTLGGSGTNGMLGALARAIANAGTTLPVSISVQQAANSNMNVSAYATAGTAMSPFTSALTSAGIPTTIGGISTTTLLLIGLGILVISQMGKK